MTAVPIVLDTDPGLGEPGSDIDDGLAVVLALRSPELDVKALTIVNGNVDVATGTGVAIRLLERLGREDIPVAAGARQSLVRDTDRVRRAFAAVPARDAHVHGEPRPATTTEFAPDTLVRLAAEHPGELVVVAIGPLTNVALAVHRDPSFARNVREVVAMVGSATTYAQNISVLGDFNAFVDPEAVHVVLTSGVPLRMVGLDQTSRVHLTRDDAAALRAGSDPLGAWLADCTEGWIDYLAHAFPNRPEHRDACFLHDPLVLASVVRPDLLTWAPASVRVELGSELCRGLLVADRGLALEQPPPMNATVAVDTDVDGFRSFFLERLHAPGNQYSHR